MPSEYDLGQFEPSSCDCPACRQTCHSRPGLCTPGDIDRIVQHLGVEGDAEFLQDHFRPLGGPPVDFGGNEPVNVPVIVPATREDGSCVFLTLDERCGIEAVKPFGCSRCNGCDKPEDNAAVELAIVWSIAESPDYLDLWCELVYGPPVT